MSAEFIWKLWNQHYGLSQENFYSNLLETSRNLLDFKTPQGLQMNFTSCPSETFANSHRLTIFPNIGGSLSFLHSSRPLLGYKGTKTVPLDEVVAGYKTVLDNQEADDTYLKEIWYRGRRIDYQSTLLYGRLHMPHSKLEAIYARRLSPTRQLILTALSSSELPNQGTIFVQLQQEFERHTNEWIYNTDDALIGYRHMRHLGEDAKVKFSRILAEAQLSEKMDPAATLLSELPFPELPADLPLSTYGRFSAGLEIYYGALHKSGGISFGMKFATLPFYHGSPRTMTLTVNPLVGHLSSTYSMKVQGLTTVCSRLDFNIFSYESDLTLGAELWHYNARPKIDMKDGDKAEHAPEYPRSRLDFEKAVPETTGQGESAVLQPSGVIKAYMHSATLSGGLLWEGRIKDFLVSFGGKFDLTKGSISNVGIEIQYGS